MKKNNIFTSYSRLLIVIIVLSIILFSYISADFLFASDYEIISISSTNNSRPQITIDDYNNAHIVWQGEVDGKESIFYRELRNGKWDDIITVDDGSHSKNRNPSILVNPNSNVHIFWSGLIGTNLRIFHSYRINNYWYKDSIPVDNQPDQDNEFPVATMDKDKNIHLVWFSGNGISDRIYYAISKNGIHFDIYGPLDDNPNSYNWYPQVFDLDQILLTYFASINSNFYLKAFEIDKTNMLLRNINRYNLDPTIANKIPQLLMDKNDNIIALWYNGYDKNDRIYMLNNNEISIIDNNPDEDNFFPYGKIDKENNLHIVWCSASQTESKILYTCINNNSSEDKEILIDIENKYFFSPMVDIDSTGTPHCVWYSSYSDGGDGSIYYKKLSTEEINSNTTESYSIPFTQDIKSALDTVITTLIRDELLFYYTYNE